MAAAGRIGYPVALKAASPDIAHKTETGLVKLNLRTGAEFAAAWRELEGILAQHHAGARREGMLVQGMVRSAGGKSGASDASAEVVGRLRKLFNDNGVMWQMAELGKTDAGGGGTVAKYMAKRNIDTLDAGVPVLSMHAPYETVAKLDCYMTYKGMKVFFEQN